MLELGCATRGARHARCAALCAAACHVPTETSKSCQLPLSQWQTIPSCCALRNRHLLGLENNCGPRAEAKGSAGDVCIATQWQHHGCDTTQCFTGTTAAQVWFPHPQATAWCSSGSAGSPSHYTAQTCNLSPVSSEVRKCQTCL